MKKNKILEATIYNSLFAKKRAVLFHIVFNQRLKIVRYLLFFLVIYWPEIQSDIILGQGNEIPNYPVKFLCLVFIHICIIYYVLGILLPKIFENKNYTAFIVSSFLLEAFYTYLTWYILDINFPEFNFVGFWNYFIMILFFQLQVLSTAVGIKLFKIWYFDQIIIKSIEKEKNETELQFLKNQINPHSLFNSLNNILVLHNVNHPDTSKHIIGLSEVLKYQLYTSTQQKVSLKKELEYLIHYIEIEKVRIANLEFKLIIHDEDNTISKIEIEPLLFTAFVENAFKHSRKNNKGHYIYLDFYIDKNSIKYIGINSYMPKINTDKNSGVGYNNIKKRLELIYPDRYKIEELYSEDEYKVEFLINLI